MAVTCQISATDLAFGTYNIHDTASLKATSQIDIECILAQEAVATAYSISLDSGNAGTYQPRLMSSATHTLAYNLYTGPDYAVIWGDGTNGTATVDREEAVNQHTVYGLIPPEQSAAAPGQYQDTIIATVYF